MKRKYPCVIENLKDHTSTENKKTDSIILLNLNDDEVISKLNFGSSVFKNIGKKPEDISTNKEINELLNIQLKEINENIILNNKKDPIIDEKLKSLIFELNKLSEDINHHEEKLKLINELKKEFNNYILKESKSILEASWVSNDSLMDKSNDLKLLTQKSIQEYINRKINPVQKSFEGMLNKLKILNYNSQLIPIIINKANNKSIFIKKDNTIIPISFKTLRNFLNIIDITSEIIKDNNGILKEDISNDWDNKDLTKIPNQNSVMMFISNILKSLTLDKIKEGKVNKFFNNKTLDMIEDGKEYIKMSTINAQKLENIQENANVTNKESVKNSGALMKEDILDLMYPSNDMASELKIPTIKSVRDFINSLFKNLTLDDIQNGTLFKHITPELIQTLNNNIKNILKQLNDYKELIDNKTTDNLKVGNNNKFLTNETSIDNIKEGKENKYFNGKTTDNLPEGKNNKYFSKDLTLDNIKEGKKNKFNLIPNHNENKYIQGGKINEYYHLDKNEFNTLKDLQGLTPDILCVDKITGKDDNENGLSFESPYNTIQYTLGNISKVLNNDIIINIINNQSEEININNINSLNNNTIYFIGELEKIFEDNSNDKTQGSLQNTSSENYSNKLLKINKEYYIIDGHNLSTLNICGKFKNIQSERYKIYNWKTIFNKILNIKNSKCKTIFKDIKFEDDINIYNQNNMVTFVNCFFNKNININQSKVKFKNCISNAEININNNSICQFEKCKLLNLNVSYMSNVKIGSGCILSEQINKNSTAILCTINSIVDMHSNEKDGNIIIRNYNIGLESSINSSIVNTENIQFYDIQTMNKNPIYFNNGFID